MITSATAPPSEPYRGRFAPSPTGSLHAGSLVAALASFLDARHQGGVWRLRFDDIDPPRAVSGSKQSIVAALRGHGLNWDEPILYQSEHSERYESALQELWQLGYLFRCICTRTTLASGGTCGQDCRNADHPAMLAHSLRVRVTPERLQDFTDRFMGEQAVPTERMPADFIVKRRDGLFAYQLAAAVDDALPHFTNVVRGDDLLSSTHRQRWLQQLLGQTSPHYAHVGVVCDHMGNKLSKQNGAEALNVKDAEENLRNALRHLRQPPPPASAKTTIELLGFAIEHWSKTQNHH